MAAAAGQLANERHAAMRLIILRRPHMGSFRAVKPPVGPGRQIGNELRGVLPVAADRVAVAADQEKFFSTMHCGTQ